MNHISLGHHWVPLILERLRPLAALPSHGILAGQAVASAILAELGKGTAVYNDVDVFLLATAEKEKELASHTHLESEALRLGIPAAELDDYRNMTLNSHKDLEILGSTQEGLLNLIWCKQSKARLSGSRVIHSFDLNAVEVGIDLSTNELYWSRAFEYFIKTYELQVTSLNTPERTLLRYFKKREELGAYGNDSLVVDMTSRWMAAIDGDNPPTARTGLLTRKFWLLAKKFESRYSDALRLDEDLKKLVCLRSWKEKIPSPVDAVLNVAILDHELPGRARLITRHCYGRALTYSKELKNLFDADFSEHCVEDEGPRKVIAESLIWLRHEYLADHRTDKHYETVSRLLAAHPEVCGAVLGLTLDEQYHCVLDLRKRAKADGDYIYGIVESDAIPADMWNQSHRDAFFKRIEREESIEQLAAPLLPDREIKDIKIRELLTTRELRVEGSQMGHCVGGYSSRVASGKSRILSLRASGGSKMWSTAEISFRENEKLILVKQHYSKGNSPVTDDSKAALDQYLQEAAEKFGFSVNNPLNCLSATEQLWPF